MFPEFNLGPEILQAVLTAGIVLITYFAVLWLSLVVWTFNDIRQRTGNWLGRILAALLVLVLGLPGLILYVLLRPKYTVSESFERALEEEALLQDMEERLVCASCRRRVREDWVVCPHCEAELKEPCRKCARPLNREWNVCPHCTTPTRRQAAAPARVEAPEPAR